MRILFLSLCICLGCGGRIEGDTNVVNGGSGGGNTGGSGGSGGGSSGSGIVCDGQLATAKMPRKLASDGSYVYWTTWGDPGTQKNGSIWRVSVHGGTPEKLADDVESTTDIVVDSSRVYWVGYTAHVASVPKSGGAVKIHTTGSVGRIALDGSTLFVSRTDRITRIDGDVESPVVQGDGIDPIAVSDRVWFVERGHGRLRWAPKTGGDAHTVAAAEELASVYDLAADPTGVFGVTTVSGVIWHADENGLFPRLKAGFQCPANVATAGSDFYFGNVAVACENDLDFSKREIVRLSNNTAKIVGHAMLSGMSGIAVDDATVYWSGGDGIYCAPR